MAEDPSITEASDSHSDEVVEIDLSSWRQGEAQSDLAAWPQPTRGTTDAGPPALLPRILATDGLPRDEDLSSTPRCRGGGHPPSCICSIRHFVPEFERRACHPFQPTMSPFPGSIVTLSDRLCRPFRDPQAPAALAAGAEAHRSIASSLIRRQSHPQRGHLRGLRHAHSPSQHPRQDKSDLQPPPEIARSPPACLDLSRAYRPGSVSTSASSTPGSSR